MVLMGVLFLWSTTSQWLYHIKLVGSVIIFPTVSAELYTISYNGATIHNTFYLIVVNLNC